jgi:hypothetical protein
LLYVGRSAAYDDNDCILVDTGSGNGFTNSGTAAGDNDDAVLEVEIHICSTANEISAD